MPSPGRPASAGPRPVSRRACGDRREDEGRDRSHPASGRPRRRRKSLIVTQAGVPPANLVTRLIADSVHAGDLELLANTLKDGIGGTNGFRPHDLLEAALAACMNITARMAAQKAGVALERVTTSVRLEREGEGPVTFKCSLSIVGKPSEEKRAAVASAVARCPCAARCRGPSSLCSRTRRTAYWDRL